MIYCSLETTHISRYKKKDRPLDQVNFRTQEFWVEVSLLLYSSGDLVIFFSVIIVRV